MSETPKPPFPTPDELSAKWAAEIAAAGVATEAQMQESEAPSPRTAEELAAYVATLVDRPHDYGTCVYAMSLAAVATFNFVAGKLGVTGFQASCADMDIVRRTRHMTMGFLLLKQQDLLYPQYDLRVRVEEWIAKSAPELAKEAAKLLADPENNTAHPNVRAHWKRLAKAAESA